MSSEVPNVYTVLIGVVGLMTAVTSLVTAVVVLLAAAVFRANLHKP